MVSVNVDIGNSLKVIEGAAFIIHNQRRYKIFRTAAELLLKVYWAETFKLSGARRGHEKWKPLSERYAKRKKSKGKSFKPLILTGHLQGSPKILEDTQNTLTFGTTVPYAHWHQEGGTVKDRPPKREFIFITEKDFSEIQEFLTALIQQTLDAIKDKK